MTLALEEASFHRLRSIPGSLHPRRSLLEISVSTDDSGVAVAWTVHATFAGAPIGLPRSRAESSSERSRSGLDRAFAPVVGLRGRPNGIDQTHR